MHPRAIVGPPGTVPNLDPRSGLPHLRRGRVGNPVLQFGVGAPVQIPSSSVAVDIQANPQGFFTSAQVSGTPTMNYPKRVAARRRNAAPLTRGGICGPHRKWDPKTKQCVPKTQRMGGAAKPGVLGGDGCWNACAHWGASIMFHKCYHSCKSTGWPLPRSGQRARITVRGVAENPENPVSVGACFPKFDPIQMYGVGQPPQPTTVVNPTPMMQTRSQIPGIDRGTGMPRRRRSAQTIARFLQARRRQGIRGRSHRDCIIGCKPFVNNYHLFTQCMDTCDAVYR